jgi:hypothetical protein
MSSTCSRVNACDWSTTFSKIRAMYTKGHYEMRVGEALTFDTADLTCQGVLGEKIQTDSHASFRLNRNLLSHSMPALF